MASGRKQIAFDLDTKMVKEYYPTENWQNAYRDIRKFMNSNDFQWAQGSVYTSKAARNPHEIRTIISAMIDKYPWLNVCMRDCVVTNIGRSHSQNYLFDKNADIQPREKTAEADKVMDIVKDVVYSKAMFFVSDEIENEIER